MTLPQTAADLSYWPRQHVFGFFRLWRFNGLGLALRLTAFNLLRARRIFQVRLNGFSIALRSGTPDLAVALDSLGREFDPVANIADPAGLIIDAGGYIGTAALRFAAMFPRSKVICLEPASENLEMLRHNVGPVANVVVMQAALAPTEGEATLGDPGSGEWGFSILENPQHRTLRAVPTVTVESILAHEGRDRLFLLKLDVEGAEAAILESSAGWMGRTEIVIAELHDKLVPGVGKAFDRATAGRTNTRLPGEKVLSIR